MERSATAFTAADRIGQLAVQVNDIADTQRMLAAQRRLRLVAAASRLRPARARLVTLWAGRVGGTALAPEVVGVPARRTTPSSCPTTSQGR